LGSVIAKIVRAALILIGKDVARITFTRRGGLQDGEVRSLLIIVDYDFDSLIDEVGSFHIASGEDAFKGRVQ